MKASFIDRVIWPDPGHYVVAVSGGVDSMALLDLLAAHSESGQWQLEVAHFDHGWSYESKRYAEIVRHVTKEHDLTFHSVRRPVKRAEAEARDARYTYLREVMRETGARAIITAQHQDDLVETLLMNIERGTGRYGLSPFLSSLDVVRPLITVRKAELVAYASERGLAWHEDPANHDPAFRRTVFRYELIPELRKQYPDFDARMLAIAKEAAVLNRRIDEGLMQYFEVKAEKAMANASQLRRLPFATLTEVLVAMARAVQPGAELDRLAVEQLALDCKTGRIRQTRQLTNRLSVSYSRDRVITVFTP